MARYVMCDAGFWFAVFDPRDQHHQAAKRIVERVRTRTLLLPWPSLHEVLNTRFVRRVEWVRGFARVLRRGGSRRLNDEPYRERTLESVVLGPPRRALSLVDAVMAAMIEDPSVRVDALVTFNPSDFSAVCVTRGVEIIGQEASDERP